MSAGTITLTNNSTAVTGTGTAFTADLKPNDVAVVVVGGTTYTLGVKSIESDTALTLVRNYAGANQSGVAWTAVPAATMASITAQLAADVAYSIRGLNFDKDNWQKIFTGEGDVTVTLPDFSQWTGPAWGGLVNSLQSKADQSAVQKISEELQKKSDQSAVDEISENLKSKISKSDIGTTAGTVAAGDDSRIVGALPASGGKITGSIQMDSSGAGRTNTSNARYKTSDNITVIDTDSWTQVEIGVGTQIVQQIVANSGSYMGITFTIGNTGFHTFRHDGNIVTSAGNVQISASDGRIKSKEGAPKGDALERVKKLAENAVQDYKWLKYQADINNYRYEQPQRGFIAQDAYAIDPVYAARPEFGADTDMPKSGENIWGLNTNAILADAVLAIHEQQKQIDELKADLEKIKGV